MSINKAIEKLENLKEAICILPDELIEEEIHRSINDLKSIEKVTYSKILEAEFQSTKNAIKVVDEINLRIWGV